MSTPDGWIKMSERKPTKADRPFWVVNKNDRTVWLWEALGEDFLMDYSILSHWQPATIPEPPKKELTQREKDEEGFNEYAKTLFFGSSCVSVYPRLAWHAALAYRDKQNAEDLAVLHSKPIFRWE